MPNNGLRLKVWDLTTVRHWHKATEPMIQQIGVSLDEHFRQGGQPLLSSGSGQQDSYTEVSLCESVNRSQKPLDNLPSVIFATAIHVSILTFTAAGTVTVRSRFPFPTRSGMTHRPSRCRIRSTSRPTSSARRSPQEIKKARGWRGRACL